MKVLINNLGPLQKAEFEIGDLTIICGENNTGKSYLSHATHGALEALSSLHFPVQADDLDKILKGGKVKISLSSYQENLNKTLTQFSEKYSRTLGEVLFGDENKFTDAQLNMQVDSSDAHFLATGVSTHISIDEWNLEIQTSNNSESLDIASYENRPTDIKLDRFLIENAISQSIRYSLLGIDMKPVIASAVRSGISLFHPELDFNKSRVLDLIRKNVKNNDLSLDILLNQFGGNYPHAIRRNLDFMRRLPSISSRKSRLLLDKPDILDLFIDIIGGDLRINNEGIVSFTPTSNKEMQLNLHDSSSTVTSLLVVNFFIRHIADPYQGDILIIDEPELNLHPENQCKLARLFARLVNSGIKVFISTHSDYILKELNTLIMLNGDEAWVKEIANNEGYITNELLKPEQIKAYRTAQIETDKDAVNQNLIFHTLVPMEIDNDLGIDGPSFDMTIDRMNRIQSEIVLGGDI